MTRSSPICFQCGQSTETSPARLNRLDDGRPCRSCSDRLLASLPPLLPGGSDRSQEQEAPEGPFEHELGGFGSDLGPDAEPA